MNYYIDFDNTLYDTAKLTERMLTSISTSIHQQISEFTFDELFVECKSMFNREHIYNIYELVDYFSNKYSLEASPIVKNLNDTILACKDLVFEDSIPFLKQLKENGNKIFLLSYQPGRIEFSLLKIAGSHLSDLFDGLYICDTPKYELDINYSSGIFIDDNPQDLIGLHSKSPLRLIRLKRPGTKYASQSIDGLNIEEYTSFNDIS